MRVVTRSINSHGQINQTMSAGFLCVDYFIKNKFISNM